MPVQLQVKIANRKVQVGLQKVGAAIPNLLDKEVRKVMEFAKRKASGFWSGGNRYQVPRLPGQHYRRTGRYGRGTTLYKVKPKTYMIRQTAVYKGREYAPFVGGGANGTKQASIHGGRWPLLRTAVMEAAAKFVEALPDDLRKLFRQEGIGL